MVWIGYGAWLARSGVAKGVMARSKRGHVAGPAILILGTAAFAGALYVIATSNGLSNGALRPWAVAIVLASGVAFVHAQCLGALMILGASVKSETRLRPQPSVQQEDSP